MTDLHDRCATCDRSAKRLARKVDDDDASVRDEVGAQAAVEVGGQQVFPLARPAEHGQVRFERLHERRAVELVDLVP